MYQTVESLCLKETIDRAAIIQLIKACGIKKDIWTMTRIRSDKPWITDDVTIANTFIRSYFRCGAVKNAKEVFDQLSERNVVSWNALISGYAEHGFCRDALRCLTEMQNNRLTPDSVTYTSSLKACASIGALETVKKIHSQVREQKLLNKLIVLGTALVNAYAKCGALKEAQEVFDQLATRDAVSWSALINGYVDHGFSEEALTCFREMENDGVTPNVVTYLCSLKACSIVGALEIVQEIHARVSEQGLLNKDIALGNALINAYAKAGAVKEAREMFDQLADRNVVTWNALLTGYADQEFAEEALACFREIENDGLIPDLVTYTSCLKASAILRAVNIVQEIHVRLREQGLLNEHITLGNSLVTAYAKCGAIKEAQEVFDLLVDRNVVSWSALIAGYTDQGFCEEALRCLKGMQSNRVVPDLLCCVSSLKACAIIGAYEIVKEIHTHIKEQGLVRKHIILGNSLVNAYAKCGAVKEAQEVFDQLSERDVVSWSSLLAGYTEEGLGEEALRCFKEMRNHRVIPNSVTYSYSLVACTIVGALDTVKEIHAQLTEQGLLEKHVVLGNALVNAYAKCGSVMKAQEVFDLLRERDVVSWNAVIIGYAQFGQVNEMLQQLNRMITEDIFPDSVTFVILLNGCSHGALLEEGERLFYTIETYGLSLTPEHYTCMVDLFGRAGRFDDAKCFVVDHTPTLLAFLGACRKWVNVDLGRWAFEELLRLDQNCGSAYVSMANIYAAGGKSSR